MDCPDGTFLEVGAGTGALTAQAASFGFKSKGTDPSPVIVQQAQERGRNIEIGTAYNISNESWNVIYLADVFEHLTRPKDCLSSAWTALDPMGMLVIEMPEEGCPQSNHQGMSWRHYRPLQHVYLYNEGAARSLFEKSGYYVEAVTRPVRGSIGKIVYYLRKVLKTA